MLAHSLYTHALDHDVVYCSTLHDTRADSGTHDEDVAHSSTLQHMQLQLSTLSTARPYLGTLDKTLHTRDTRIK
jgi:hypothetical protein